RPAGGRHPVPAEKAVQVRHTAVEVAAEETDDRRGNVEAMVRLQFAAEVSWIQSAGESDNAAVALRDEPAVAGERAAEVPSAAAALQRQPGNALFVLRRDVDGRTGAGQEVLLAGPEIDGLLFQPVLVGAAFLYPVQCRAVAREFETEADAVGAGDGDV